MRDVTGDAAVVADILRRRLQENAEALNAYVAETPAFTRAVMLVKDCLASGGNILLCGNGGNASAASHIVNDFVGHMYFDRPSMGAVSLADNVPAMTAIANDYGYDQIFSRQVDGIGRPGDVLMGFSTSGNSANVLLAVEAAKAKGMAAIGLTNHSGGKLAKVVDVWLRTSSLETVCSEHLHLVMIHTLCECVERLLYQDHPAWAARKQAKP
jgi:D-sedoheptulose 7-phosphate isomerase